MQRQEEQKTQYMVISFSHKNTDIAMREKLNITQAKILPFLQEINESESISESILLCTCNRIEIYVSMYDRKIARSHIYATLAKYTGLDSILIEENAIVRLNEYAIYHIFGVASSLDSLVVGETQITGQLKNAYKLSFDNKLCGKDMTRLMHFAFKCAANVRQETDISAHSVSVASTAVRMAEHKLKQVGQNLDSTHALVIGSGEMGRLACKHLLNAGAKITLLSRTKQNAYNLAKELDSKNVNTESFENLAEILNNFTLLFSATSATECVIKADMVKSSQVKRLWFDLALPRDIESVKMADLEIFCVDDLQEIIKEHKGVRDESAKEAHKILESYTRDFFTWLQTLSVEPIIKHIRYLAKQSSLKELDRAIKKGFLPSEYRQNVEKILHGAFNSFLHNPTMRLRQASESHQGDPIIEAMKSMFDIGDEVVMLSNYKCEKDTTIVKEDI
ncbi:glutamyl-tRNA reductase [Helicobacter cinaedi]|uniref:Glutamyl-tRNA reductase n=1 Tax=Helicobacter cinaedi TaxID=213 RepID=A0A377JSD9_9HELI|nr:glutamyl-tRNA reductase [Helicobacter cinaedi]STP10889.1 glutamyl-tRNA reductase [Helicobacter cinaedi]